jgi:hypothetical protein
VLTMSGVCLSLCVCVCVCVCTYLLHSSIVSYKILGTRVGYVTREVQVDEFIIPPSNKSKSFMFHTSQVTIHFLTVRTCQSALILLKLLPIPAAHTESPKLCTGRLLNYKDMKHKRSLAAAIAQLEDFRVR